MTYKVPWCIPTNQTYLVFWRDVDDWYKADFQSFFEALEFVREHDANLIDWGIGWRKHNVWMVQKRRAL